MTRRPSFLCRGCFLFLALGLLGGLGVQAGPVQAGEQVASRPGPILEVKIRDEAAKPQTPASTVALDPFFVIREEGTRVRVRRVQVAVEFSEADMLSKFDPQSPALREKVYDFLLAEEQALSGREKKEEEKILAQLVNRYLGQEAVSAVKVDQSFLLLH